MKKTNKHHFRDILEYAKTAISFIDEMDYNDFSNDIKTAFAIIRAL